MFNPIPGYIDPSPYSFAAVSKSTIDFFVSQDKNNASILPNLELSPGSRGFKVFPLLGAVQNDTGRDVVRAAGELALQILKTGGSAVTIFIYSETSDDMGATWSINEGSLRTKEVTASSDGFVTIPSSTDFWPKKGLVRFRVYWEGGGSLSIRASTDTIAAGPLTGRASYWKLSVKFN